MRVRRWEGGTHTQQHVRLHLCRMPPNRAVSGLHVPAHPLDPATLPASSRACLPASSSCPADVLARFESDLRYLASVELHPALRSSASSSLTASEGGGAGGGTAAAGAVSAAASATSAASSTASAAGASGSLGGAPTLLQLVDAPALREAAAAASRGHAHFSGKVAELEGLFGALKGELEALFMQVGIKCNSKSGVAMLLSLPSLLLDRWHAGDAALNNCGSCLGPSGRTLPAASQLPCHPCHAALRCILTRRPPAWTWRR